MTPTFPGRVVRGLAIRTGRPSNCAPDSTNFTLDFEPLDRPGYEFVADLDYGFDDYYQELHAEYAPAISLGVQLNLSGAPKPAGFGPLELTGTGDRLDERADGPLIAVRVVLAKVRYHGVDSAPGPHSAAAWEVTQRLREQLG
ncbi:hypothetical protein [Kribbella sp. DT2]|uniref:hypothetical protein n=1 Tax=Kribbella sp. DT2 TaxID=3393427 RepID=UPI003CE9128F